MKGGREVGSPASHRKTRTTNTARQCSHCSKGVLSKGVLPKGVPLKVCSLKVYPSMCASSRCPSRCAPQGVPLKVCPQGVPLKVCSLKVCSLKVCPSRCAPQGVPLLVCAMIPPWLRWRQSRGSHVSTRVLSMATRRQGPQGRIHRATPPPLSTSLHPASLSTRPPHPLQSCFLGPVSASLSFWVLPNPKPRAGFTLHLDLPPPWVHPAFGPPHLWSTPTVGPLWPRSQSSALASPPVVRSGLAPSPLPWPRPQSSALASPPALCPGLAPSPLPWPRPQSSALASPPVLCPGLAPSPLPCVRLAALDQPSPDLVTQCLFVDNFKQFEVRRLGAS